MDVPVEIQQAVSALLKPYGVSVTDLFKDSSNRKYFTPKQASEFCGLSAKTIRDKALAGEIRSIRLGSNSQSRVLIDRNDFYNWLEHSSRKITTA